MKTFLIGSKNFRRGGRGKKIGAAACFFMIAIMLVLAAGCSGGGQRLTEENCGEYLEISAHCTQSFGEDVCIVNVLSRADISDFSITVSVWFRNTETGENLQKSESITLPSLGVSQTAQGRIALDGGGFTVTGTSVLSVSGKLV